MLGRWKYIVPGWFVSVCLLEWMNNVVHWLLGTWIMGYDKEHPTMAPNFCRLARLGFKRPNGIILSSKCFELLASQGHMSTICSARGCIIKMTYQAACPLILFDACTHALYRGFFFCVPFFSFSLRVVRLSCIHCVLPLLLAALLLLFDLRHHCEQPFVKLVHSSSLYLL